MKKFIINKVSSDKRFSIKSLLNQYDNISIFEKKGDICIEIFCEDVNFVKLTENQIKKQFGSYKLVNFEKQNWLSKNIDEDKGIKSELFFISQGLLEKEKVKKFNLKIPANNAFGTGSHESTFLSIKCIEFLTKKKDYSKMCDVGTGSGILSFILRKITKKKIISIDNDYKIKDTFLENAKNNNLNELFFFKNNGLRGKTIMNTKFDLIVCNILCNFHKKAIKDYYKKLKYNGEIIISGILDEQTNEIISYFKTFNLKLKKKFSHFGWSSLIFKKTGFKHATKLRKIS